MKFLILAGGGGTRLWPLSRQLWPKQFLNLNPERENESLLLGTIQRILDGDCSPDDIFIVTEAGLYLQTLRHLQHAGLGNLAGNVICEPQRKNTAPAIAMAMTYIQENCICEPDEVLAILPADHQIGDSLGFNAHLRQAEKLAQQGFVVTLGVPPRYPETGYGYIEVEQDYQSAAWMPIKRFVEKPGPKQAERYVQSGRFLWNAGIFVLSMPSLQSALEKFAPDIYHIVRQGYAQAALDFAKMPEISFDYAVMEKVDNAAVIPLQVAWSDLGSWDSVFDTLKTDEGGNAEVGGKTLQIASGGNLIWNQSERLIAALGVSDLMVVDTPDVLLLARRGESQRVRELVGRLEEMSPSPMPARQNFAWGSVRLLNWHHQVNETPIYQLKLNSQTTIYMKGDQNLAGILLVDGELFSEKGRPLPRFSLLSASEGCLATTCQAGATLLLIGEIPEIEDMTERHQQPALATL
ncbi:MAG TPA: sugar phosphate nucleotidyltransferase [Oculatellaceae cyanobacterium]